MKLTKIKKKNNYQPSQDTPKLPIRRDVCDEFVNLKAATIEGQNMNMTDFVTMVISEFIKNVKIEEVELKGDK